MQYSARTFPAPFQYSTMTSPIVGLANLPTGKARLVQTITTSTVGQEVLRRSAALVPAATAGGSTGSAGARTPAPTAGDDTRALCEVYLRQLDDAARSRGAPLSAEGRASLLAVCAQDAARFKAEIQSRLGVTLRDAPSADDGNGDAEEKSNTWLWVAGGAAVFGVLLLARK